MSEAGVAKLDREVARVVGRGFAVESRTLGADGRVGRS